jgi:HlyD family secretion protein
VRVKNDELKLKPGMTANVSITVAQRKGILRVPNAALRFKPPESIPAPGAERPKTAGKPKGAKPERKVHLLREGELKPAPTPVKLGISDNLFTEVISGVSEGDVVVTGLKNSAPSSAIKPPTNPLGAPTMRPR